MSPEFQYSIIVINDVIQGEPFNTPIYFNNPDSGAIYGGKGMSEDKMKVVYNTYPCDIVYPTKTESQVYYGGSGVYDPVAERATWTLNIVEENALELKKKEKKQQLKRIYNQFETSEINGEKMLRILVRAIGHLSDGKTALDNAFLSNFKDRAARFLQKDTACTDKEAEIDAATSIGELDAVDINI